MKRIYDWLRRGASTPDRFYFVSWNTMETAPRFLSPKTMIIISIERAHTHLRHNTRADHTARIMCTYIVYT